MSYMWCAGPKYYVQECRQRKDDYRKELEKAKKKVEYWEDAAKEAERQYRESLESDY